MGEHYASQHKDAPAGNAWRPCKAQRFQKGGGQSGNQLLWEVSQAGDCEAGAIATDQFILDILNKIGEELVVPTAPQDDRMVSPWLLTTRWHEHTFGHVTERLRGMVTIPKDDDDEDLLKLKEAVGVYFQYALDLLPTTDEITLQRLNSPDPKKLGISNTPFHKHQDKDTMRRYILPIVSLLAMLIRSDDSSDYHIPMHPDLQYLITALDGSVARNSPYQLTDISLIVHQILMHIWTTKWKRMPENLIPDPTERCLALLTLQKDGSFKEPKDVTGIIAKDEYCIRLAFLTEIRNRVALGEAEDESAAFDQLEPYLTEHNHYTFSRLRSLQHRASSLAYSAAGLPRIWWTDATTWSAMLYKGNRIDLGDVRKMLADTETRLVDLWENFVLKGLRIRIDYRAISDDLTNKDVGYSFLSDPRNPCFARRDRLLEAFFRNKDIFGHFGVVRQGSMIWNKGNLRRWLQDYADFHSLLLLRCEMLSGAPGRGTELTAMTYRNTSTRPTRNLVILGKHVAMLCLYSKTGALTGRDKLIPHSLDAVTGDILIQDLALARPFAEFAASVCFLDNAQVKELYRQQMFIKFDRLFNSSDLSSTMTRHSLPTLNYGLTINSWRHIQTAWKRKFRCSAEDLLEEDTEDTVDALQAGHSRATENRLYGLSVETLAGPAEDVLPLFLNASTTWQVRCKAVPGGALLPYTEARFNHNHSLSESALAQDAYRGKGTPSNTSLVPNADDVARRVIELLMPVLTGTIQAAISSAVASLPKPTPSPISQDIRNGFLAHQRQFQDESEEEYASDSSTCMNIIRHDVYNGIASRTPDIAVVGHALAAMKTILRDQAVAWASEQQCQAMAAVLAQQTDVIAVLRTGGGKSMLAIIPSILEKDRGATVLILPLKSLMIDFQRRLKGIGVPFQIYGACPGGLNPRENLILVTADQAHTEGWRESMAVLNQRKRIARLVFDEAHLPLIANDYREALQHIYELRSLAVQMVLLTATLPPSSVPDLKSCFGLGEDALVVRQCTNREELTYFLEKVH
ncbi:hypothetical protein EDD22DRAFT_790177, partial [Suillus occidentalis]